MVAVVVIRGVDTSRAEVGVEGDLRISGIGRGGPEGAMVACAPE